MIKLTFAGVAWGVQPMNDPNADPGVFIHLLDNESKISVEIPFNGPPLTSFVRQLLIHLTDDERRSLAPVVTGGLHVPGRDFNPEDVILPRDGSKGGPPQG